MQGMLSQEQHLPANLCHRADSEEPLFADLFINDIYTVSPVVVKGRLRANLKFWQDIGASKWIIDIISLGYCLPFVQEPDKNIFKNHASALRDSDFVSKEISKLLKSGALLEVNESDWTVCSPLGVTRNACGKQRLILDLRYVNQHLRVSKFKYEDIPTACDLFSKGHWFFKLIILVVIIMSRFIQNILRSWGVPGQSMVNRYILSLQSFHLALPQHLLCLQKFKGCWFPTGEGKA